MTTRRECLRALRAAAERLGESPTKAQYEDLGMRPAASTILRVVGGWNDAKRQAGLDVSPSTGSRVQPKPDDVEIPEDVSWNDLSQDQRWHYRHAEENTTRTLERRQKLRAWVNERKASRGCVDCGETDPACLDFHHTTDDKEMAITDMVTAGYGRERIREELTDCEVLCANCHRKRHDRRPAVVTNGDEPRTKRERLQIWAYEFRRRRTCRECGLSDPVCLQFHHPDPDTKVDSVSGLIADSAPEAAVKDEADRCIVLCANCHRKTHVDPPRVATGSPRDRGP